MQCRIPLPPVGGAVLPMVCKYKQEKMFRDGGSNFQLINFSYKSYPFSKQAACFTLKLIAVSICLC